jgi:hypothetical protein
MSFLHGINTTAVPNLINVEGSLYRDKFQCVTFVDKNTIISDKFIQAENIAGEGLKIVPGGGIFPRVSSDPQT